MHLPQHSHSRHDTKLPALLPLHTLHSAARQEGFAGARHRSKQMMLKSSSIAPWQAQTLAQALPQLPSPAPAAS